MSKPEDEEDGKRINGLSVLYDDGYGGVSVKDYFAAAKEIVKPDGGPPRWFCPVECGQPIKDAPVLFFLPGEEFWWVLVGGSLIFWISFESM